MTLSKIVTRINALLADELYPYEYLEIYLDDVVDDINERLSATFPSFSEVVDEKTPMNFDYNFIPEKYIRTVIIKGAAFKFFIKDEEGIETAQAYGRDYQIALFNMQRDYMTEVPEEFKADNLAYVDMNIDDPPEGIKIKGWGRF